MVDYSYDANGNMTGRVIGSDTYTLFYDAENRMMEVKKNNVTIATFTYDGDGNRVQSTIGNVTTTFVGNYYEVADDGEVTTVTKYYYAGSQRIAMRTGSSVYYLLGDQLGSTSITTDASGAKVAELRYDAWGSVRYHTTDAEGHDNTPSAYRYTGQYSNVSDFGLMFYNARWYDPYLNRWTQPDTIVPGGVQGYDRYAYANNNPILYNDPSGHVACSKSNWEDSPHCRYNAASREQYDVLKHPDHFRLTDKQKEAVKFLQGCASQTTPSGACQAPSGPWLAGNSPQLTPNSSGSNPINPLDPDYQTVSISVGEGVGATGVIIWDRYENIYLGLGANAGKSLTPVSGSYARGWIGNPFDQNYPSAKDSRSFLQGLAINGSGGILGGGGATWSPFSNTNQIGWEGGLYSPQVGASITLSGMIIQGR